MNEHKNSPWWTDGTYWVVGIMLVALVLLIVSDNSKCELNISIRPIAATQPEKGGS